MTGALLVGAIAAAIAVPLFLRLFFRSAQHQVAKEKEGALVFRKNRLMRYFGSAGVCLFILPIILFAVGRGNDMTWWLALLFGFFAISLSSFFIGEIWLFDNRIEKRALWLRKTIPGTDVEALVQERGDVTVTGTHASLKFNRYYAGSEQLISEIKKRSPKLQWMQEKNPFGPPA